MTERDRRRHDLLQRLEEVLGPEHAATLMEHLPPDRWDELARREDLERIAERMATKDDLKAFATKDDLNAFATKDDLKAFATKDDLKAFATKDDLNAFATKDDLKVFATKDDLAATRTELRSEIDHVLAVLTERIDGQGYRIEALVRERIDAQTKLLVFGMIGAVLTAASIGVGAAAF
jgi:uncharacterized protein (DUF2345 family)